MIFNLMIQLLLGIPLEMVHKGIRVGTVYLLGVIAGALDPITSWNYYFLVFVESGGCHADRVICKLISTCRFSEGNSIVNVMLSAQVRLFMLSSIATRY